MLDAELIGIVGEARNRLEDAGLCSDYAGRVLRNDLRAASAELQERIEREQRLRMMGPSDTVNT